MRYLVADFETTTREEDCRVWAYAITEVGNSEEVKIGTTIDSFMEWCKTQKDNPTIYFHNLKFDSQFILYWLFHNGFKFAASGPEKASNTFTTTISDKGLYYSIEVFFKIQGKHTKKVTFLDSLKLIPLSVDAIAKSFHLSMQKGSIDYEAHDLLPEGSPLTAEEEEYIKHDVQIVAHAIDYFHKQGLMKMTIGSCALDEYKKLISPRGFKRYYPVPKYHKDVKQSYKGGWTYLNPKFAKKLIKLGVVLDVNSLYPWAMYNTYLPYGMPIYYKGKYEEDALYPLYIQCIKCSFDIKPGKLPTIQIKGTLFYQGNEYLTTSDDREVVLYLTSVDMKLFFENYEVHNPEYLGGYMFKATKGLFTDYIDKWSEAKIQAKKDGNHGLYLISKLFLNSLYGKFGTDTTVRSKIPYLDKEDDKIRFKDSDPSEKDGVYIPMAAFITSYAREKTIRAAQMITDRYNAGLSKAEFVYADTDSLHIALNGEDPDEFLANCGLEIDSTKLGAWDHEATFSKAKFLRQKCYLESHIISEEEYNKGLTREDKFLYQIVNNEFTKLKITVAGMPDGCYNQVKYNNFKIGTTYTGKLKPKIVSGGVVLADEEFTIKP